MGPGNSVPANRDALPAPPATPPGATPFGLCRNRLLRPRSPWVCGKWSGEGEAKGAGLRGLGCREPGLGSATHRTRWAPLSSPGQGSRGSRCQAGLGQDAVQAAR